MRKPTIYEALTNRIGRAPSNEELRAEVRRIIAEGSLLGLERKPRRRR